MDNTQRPAVLSVDMAHDWQGIDANTQECQQCCEVRPIPDECTECQDVSECYATGHGGGQCSAGWPVVR